MPFGIDIFILKGSYTINIFLKQITINVELL
jgi:hypothetical protein